MDFKERVKSVAICEAPNYRDNLIKYQYLICSSAFIKNDYYIIEFKEENYLHLIGVNTSLNSRDFCKKCEDGTLGLSDFDFIKKDISEKSVKGTVREKIIALPYMNELFNNSSLKAEERFIKGKIKCSFATSDNKCTLGFIKTSKSHPMSLLKGFQLNKVKEKPVDILLKKEKSKTKFDEIVIGDTSVLLNYKNLLEQIVEESLFKKVEN